MATKNKIKESGLDGKAAEIRDLHVKCEELKARSADAAREAALRAWRAGKLLIEIKSTMKHGEWLPWIGKELPGLGLATVYRYRKLAEIFETEEKIAAAIDRHDSLTGLYRAIGALGSEAEKKVDPLDDHEDSGDASKNTGETERLHQVLSRLEKIRRDMESVANEIPIESWNENEKQRVISTTRALLRIVHSFGWLDDLKASGEIDESADLGDEAVDGKEVPDAA
jgi:hypothetical protein